MFCVFLALVENENYKLDFERIYNNYKEATLRRALKLLNNNHYDAEDAFQSAWIKIAKNIGDIKSRDERAISSYIMITVEYSAINIAKANAKRNEAEKSLEIDPSEYVSDDLLFALCAKERYENIVRILEGMDKAYRDIMLMFYVQELSVKKIAETLGLNEKTVWTRLYRGKHALIEMLKKKGFVDEYNI